MKFNKVYVLIIGALSSPAYALPIPEFASAFLGIGEILLLIVAGLTLYFPFLKKFNKTNKYVYWLLFLSILCNLYYFSSYFNNNNVTDKEERPGMVWDQAARDNDPHAIDEKEAYSILLAQKRTGEQNYIFVDARSRSETELGTAQGFLKIRWPDLVSDNSFKGKKIILTCWTGMRGSEICDILRKLGVDCQYLKRGLNGWIDAGLPVNLEQNVTLAGFGTAETYPNSSTLLSPREAVKLAQSGAKIIDVRSTEQFNQKLIKDSINIPFSSLTTTQLQYQIESISAQKLFVACYGVFSCSEANALGWEMNRMGHQYLGSYSGGIDSFNDLYYSKKISSLTLFHDFINQLFKQIGLKLSIEILILLSSLILGVILFFSKNLSVYYFKSFQERLAHKKRLTLIFKDDEIAISREIQLNYQKDLKNILISFVVLGLALIYGFFIDIIYSAFGKEIIFNNGNWQNNSGLSWISIALSLAISISLTLMVFKKMSKGLFIGGLFIFLIVLVPATKISKISSLVFMMTFTVMYVIQGKTYLKNLYFKTIRDINYKNGYLPLTDAEYLIPKGTKAHNLSHLKNKGFQVPDGFIVKKIFSNQNLILKKLGNRFSVRSSALNEDQKDSSHAGLNLSIVPSNPKSFLSDIKKVFDSYKSNREEIVLLQNYIEPFYAGAVFSKHPSWGGVIVIEWGQGLSDKRMEGSENSEQIVIERVNGEIVFSSKQHKVMFEHAKNIYKLIIEVEDFYNYSVDIEWAIDKNGLWLIQARPQSALNNLNYDLLNLEKEKLLTYQFENLKTSELSLSMNNCTRISASLVCHLWDNSSSADKASRMSLWKWNNFSNQQNIYVYYFGQIWNSNRVALIKPDKISWFMAKKTFDEHHKKINSEKNNLLQGNKINLAINWNKLDKNDWLNLWNTSLQNWEKMQTFAFYFEFVAQIATDDALKILAKVNLKGEDFLSNGKDSFKENISYRSDNDYELSMPRYIELGINSEELLFGQRNFSAKSLTVFNKKTQHKIELARKLIYLREEYKHYSITMIYSLRLAILNIQKRFDLEEEVFEFEYYEIDKMFEQKFRDELKQRLIYRKKMNTYILPDQLSAKNIAMLGKEENIIEESNLNGTFVSNSCNITGNLLFIKENLSLEEIKEILKNQGSGSIVYSKFISPQLVNLASQYQVKALCSLYGSVLSHPAVLAREANMPFLINVKLNSGWKNGKHIKIMTSGQITE